MFSFQKSRADYVAVPLEEDGVGSDESSRYGRRYTPAGLRISSWRRYPEVIVYLLICAALVSVLVAGYFSNFLYPDTVFPKCSHPPAREEWRTLSDKQKAEYISAVKCLHDEPSRIRNRRQLPGGVQGRLTDDFPWVHIEMSGTTHYTPSFLLYHRYFIWLYESALRDQCGYSGLLPYWDWSLDWQDPPGSPIWDPETGFGGDGDKDGAITVKNATCVRNGPFAGYEVYYANEEPMPHCLSRSFNFSGASFAPEKLGGLYATHSSLKDFSFNLEAKSHDAIPNGIGGDFALFTAPSDPVWFLHHSNIDRLFWLWQNRDASTRFTYEKLRQESVEARKALEMAMPVYGLADDLLAKEVLDSEGGRLCYTYAHVDIPW